MYGRTGDERLLFTPDRIGAHGSAEIKRSLIHVAKTVAKLIRINIMHYIFYSCGYGFKIPVSHSEPAGRALNPFG